MVDAARAVLGPLQRLADVLGPDVLREGDPPAFAALVAGEELLLADDPSLPPPPPLPRVEPPLSSLKSVLHRAVQLLLPRGGGGGQQPRDGINVLALGFSSDRGGYAGFAPFATCYFPNTLHNALSTPAWELLLERVGDEVLTHLLVHKVILQRVGEDGGLTQLAGRPLATIVAALRVAEARPPAPVPRHRLFYQGRFAQRPGLPASHPLRRAASAEELVRAVFGAPAPGRPLRPWQRRALAPMGELLANARALNVGELLGRTCPAGAGAVDSPLSPSEKEDEGEEAELLPGGWHRAPPAPPPPTQERRALTQAGADAAEPDEPAPLLPTPNQQQEQQEQQEQQDVDALLQLQATREPDVLAMATPQGAVAQFAVGVMRRLVPLSLWGSKKNQRTFMAAVRRAVTLGRRDKLQLPTLRVGDMAWLTDGRRVASPEHLAALQARARRVAQLLLTGTVIPLLKGHFYATEADAQAQRVFYFRKPVWARLRRFALGELRGRLLAPLSRAGALAILHDKDRHTGHGKARLLPKAHGVRPIMNLSRKVTGKRHRSVNGALHNAKHVLAWAAGGSQSFVRGVADVRERWRDFAARGPGLFYVAVDVTKCFDNIRPERLLAIVERLLQGSDEFLVQKYSTVDAAGRRSFKRRVCLPEAHQQFVDLAREVTRRHEVTTDGVVYPFVRRDELLRLLREHLRATVVELDGQFFRLCNGVPQGSVLSTLLCNVYYAQFEREELADAARRGLLLRFVDDYLFVTPERGAAERFLSRFSRGWPEWGVRTNARKAAANFGPAAQRLVPWCGLVFDSDTGEVAPNLERMMRVGLSLGGGLARTPAERVRGFTSVAFANNPLVLDADVNCQRTLLENALVLFVVVAVKTVLGGGGGGDALRAAVLDGIDFAARRHETRIAYLRWAGCLAFNVVFRRLRGVRLRLEPAGRVPPRETVKWAGERVVQVMGRLS